jgi:hypothetical protein
VSGRFSAGACNGAVDPLCRILLIKIFGPGCTVWDKAATIRFVKPGRSRLYSRFLLEEDEARTIRRRRPTETAPSVDRVYRVDPKDAAGLVHGPVEKTIHIRRNRTAV